MTIILKSVRRQLTAREKVRNFYNKAKNGNVFALYKPENGYHGNDTSNFVALCALETNVKPTTIERYFREFKATEKR